MEMRQLTIQKREGTGKGPVGRLRRAGQIPAILYGGPEPVNITVSPQDIYRLTHGHEGSTQLLRVSFAGSDESRMAIIRDMQYDPVSEGLVHVDLQEVAMDRPIQVSVAVHHVGEAVGVKDTFGILEMILREVQVSCLPGDIPELLEADVSALAIGDVLTIKDLKAPSGVRILNDAHQAVATVSPPAVEEAAAVPSAEATTAAAEPEVLTERKAKEEEDAKDKGGREEKKK